MSPEVISPGERRVEQLRAREAAPDPFDPGPYRQRIEQTNQALQTKLDELGRISYQPPKHGLPYRIAEGVVAALSPAASHAIFRAPDERRQQQFEAQLGQQRLQVGALQNAAGQAEDEYSRALQTDTATRTGRAADARADYYRSRPQQVQDLKAQYTVAVNEALAAGRDHKTDPKVLQLLSAIRQLDKPARGSEYEQFLDDPKGYERFLDVKERVRSRYDKPEKPTDKSGQFNAAGVRKNNALRKLEAEWKWDREAGAFVNKNMDLLPADEFTRRKQDIQDAFEEEVTTLGGSAEHFDYPAPDGSSASSGGEEDFISDEEAAEILALPEVGGDPNKARQWAKDRGLKFR
jgi:hypothetical protein